MSEQTAEFDGIAGDYEEWFDGCGRIALLTELAVPRSVSATAPITSYSEVVKHAVLAGFRKERTLSTLLQPAPATHSIEKPVKGHVRKAGFIVLKFVK
jgi:hypothetical protein